MRFTNNTILSVVFLAGLLLVPSVHAQESEEDSSLPRFDRLDNTNSIVEEFPGLNKFLFKEADNGVRIGFGISPIGLKAESVLFSINFFQIHYLTPWLDWEIFSSSFGLLTGDSPKTKSFNFVFRTAPKFRVFKNVSFGVVAGIEFVRYPEIDAIIYKDPLASRDYEPFSNSGLIYGLTASQNFEIMTEYLLKLNQVVYFQTYSVEETREGWEYLFRDGEIRRDTGPIEPDTVFMLEVSLLF